MSSLIKYRVHEVAKDFGVTSKVIVELLLEHRRIHELREVIREELGNMAFTTERIPYTLVPEDPVLSEEEQEANGRSVLEDLEMFG